MITKIKNCIRSNVTEQPLGYATTHEFVYALLSFSADFNKLGHAGQANLLPLHIYICMYK